MTGIGIAGLLPERVQAMVRPLYRRLVQGVETERASNLRIEDFDGIAFAYREGSTDEIIIGNKASYQLAHLLAQHRLKEDACIINIGAHIGVFALMAAPDVPRGRIFAIEASKDTYNMLRINVALNRADNVSTHHLAISDTDGTCTLYHDTGHWGHSITKQLSTRSEVVDSLTLESFMNGNDIGRCDFLWLNCEGAEFPILLGSPPQTLARVDVILTDCHTHLWTKNTIDDLASHLKAAGFDVEILKHETSYNRVLARRPAQAAAT